MFIALDKLDKQFELKCDICIVGAGAAGITVAHELIGSGIDVILLEGGGKDYTEESQAIYQGTTTGRKYKNLDESRLRFFGGSTNHWAGSCRQLDEIDFERRDWVENSGWPISKSDIAPYYERASKYTPLTSEPENLWVI